MNRVTFRVNKKMIRKKLYRLWNPKKNKEKIKIKSKEIKEKNV